MSDTEIPENESLLTKVAKALSRPDLLEREPDWMEWMIGSLSIIALEKSWHYVGYICALHHSASCITPTTNSLEDEAEGLIRLCIYNHRIADALHIRTTMMNGANTVPLPAQPKLPARKWNFPNTDRWVEVATIKAIVTELKDEAAAKVGKNRVQWIERKLASSLKDLNDRLKDGALMRLMRHAGALNEMQWQRLTKDTIKEAVHLRLHFATAFLTVSIRIGSVTARHRINLPFVFGPRMSDLERKHVDSHYGARVLAHVVYEMLLAIRTKAPITDLVPRLNALYGFFIGPLLVKPEVEKSIAALGERPTLVILTHGVLAQLPFSAFHDGTQFLAERFDVIQSPPFYPEEDFGTGDIDYEALTGGTPMKPSDVIRIMADTEGLPAAKEELKSYQRMASLPGQPIEIGPLNKEGPWSLDDLRWLFGGDVSVLSSHIRASPSNVNASVVLDPTGREFRFNEFLGQQQNNKLVVLAGCDSQGQTDWFGAGENSVVNLFRRRGAEATVSTLWSVDDLSARIYNEELVDGIRRGLTRARAHGNAVRRVMSFDATGGGQPAALRRAREKDMEAEVDSTGSLSKLDHPFYWAAFALSGAWR